MEKRPYHTPSASPSLLALVAKLEAKLKEDQRQSGSDAHPLYQSAINDLERLASVFATNAKEVTS